MNLVAVIPTFGNVETVDEVVRQSSRYVRPVIVVNDGSTDGTHQRLRALQREIDGLEVLTNSRNRGKGIALRFGIERAKELGATHVVTIDADGQHDPADIPTLAAAAQQNPDAIILGARERAIEGYPRRCRIGRTIANWALFVQCGARVSDSQCGMRVYPVRAIEPSKCTAHRYSFETELLVRAVWAGRRLIEVPIRCEYAATRVSHWRPWVDSIRELLVQLRLFAIGLVPRPIAIVSYCDEKAGLASRIRVWVSPLRLWREMRRDEAGPARTAAGVSVGVFIGISPLFGLHTMLCLYVAWRFRLHPIAVVLGSQVGIPPLAIPIGAAAIQIGHVVRSGALLTSLPDESTNMWVWSGQIGFDWILGSLILGVVLSLVTYGVVMMLCRPLVRSTGTATG